ncbi:MAG: hypothetical protein ACXAC5_05395 [Promethearchaeota archaeon]|jgi:hypothetical protein
MKRIYVPDPELEEEIAAVINSRLENGADFNTPNGGGGYIWAGPQDGNVFCTPIVDDDGHYFEITVRKCKDK